MSKALADLPHDFIDTTKFYVDHFGQYDWQAWGDFANETIHTLNTLMSSNPMQ